MDVAQPIAPAVSETRDATERARDRLFTGLVLNRGDAAFRTAFRLLGEREAAHDAVQDALIVALDRLPTVADERDAAAWLFRVLVNICMSRLRRRTVIDRAMAALRWMLPARTASSSTGIDYAHRVVPGLANLPVRQRTALILRYGDERSVAEIASALGVSPETVKTHLKRGLASLRGHLGVEAKGARDHDG